MCIAAVAAVSVLCRACTAVYASPKAFPFHSPGSKDTDDPKRRLSHTCRPL